ncbi:sugar ABC transporter ATP-binding protein [Jiangella asiatica]|uniref:Sugar ABC transporter ATP-binding protein n=1 Tax=Jiangella asiatica TaxID=2530372 RepID=A0A4V2Z2F5_9ACTN|nr:sugar ABC transporter ATP-binding protein [Jiangella asiatica]TDE08618.1 sugar ABC transporter ATP-binding protein [Jiangella asiatica]
MTAEGPARTGGGSAVVPGPLLAVEGVTKVFPGVTALDGVGFEVRPGEVHALVGENGAGKSTLVRVLGGVHGPDLGTMTLDGAPYAPQDPAEALAAGVRIVHQELSVLPNLTVAENLFLERLPRRFGVVDFRQANRDATDLLARVGLDVSPRTRMGELSVAQTQLVEIARALAARARLLVLDEPTATLTAHETRRLFEIVRDLRSMGTAVVYISHHLDEIFQVCDRVTVLRNGRHVGTHPVGDLTSADLVRLMVGREFADDHPFPGDVTPGEVVLAVDGLGVRGLDATVSFDVRAGEIVGVAGLVGAGRTETMRALFGADRADGGTVTVGGRRVTIRRPRDAVRAGISFATEDRKAQGLILPMGGDVNITLAALRKVTRGGLLRRDAERAQAAAMASRMRVKAPDITTAVGTLSGGNQQKVVLARWLYRDARVLIMDEPTRGIDVGARHEIYAIVAELARQGRAIVMVSSDLPELIGMCHRILVFSRGRVVGDVPRAEFDHERLLSLAYSGFLNGARPEPEGGDRVD